MKNANVILLMVIFLFGCNKTGKEIQGEPHTTVGFSFIVTDENGNDLFFGKNAKYDYNDICFFLDCEGEQVNCEDRDSLISYEIAAKHGVFFAHTVDVEKPYFSLNSSYLDKNYSESKVFVQFFPEKIDTINFRLTHYQVIHPSKEEELQVITINMRYNLLFNGELICTDCDRNNIYKIEVK